MYVICCYFCIFAFGGKEGKPDMDGEEREILEIWEDSPEWKEHLNSLIVRLNNEIAKKSNS